MDNEYDSLTFQNAAAFMNVSKPIFPAIFKQQSGMTFSQYLNVVRVERQCSSSTPTQNAS